jgi:hypothetical protein
MDTTMYRQSLMAAGGYDPIMTSRAIAPELPAAKDITRTPNKSSQCLTQNCIAQRQNEGAAGKASGWLFLIGFASSCNIVRDSNDPESQTAAKYIAIVDHRIL